MIDSRQPPSAEAMAAEILRLNKIIKALMDRAERSTRAQSSDYNLFQTAILLEEQVRQRTEDLANALRENERINRDLRQAKERLEQEIEQRILGEHRLRLLQDKLRDQALRDPLTGVFNRHYLAENFSRELSRVRREAIPLSLVMGDIDFFKTVNDRFGHLAGDEVLKAFAGLLASHARASDIVCRFGGEEFLLVMPGLDEAGAAARAEEIRLTFATLTVSYEGDAINATVSFGVSEFPSHGDSIDELVNAADLALYGAKSLGRNQVRRYSLLAVDRVCSGAKAG